MKALRDALNGLIAALPRCTVNGCQDLAVVGTTSHQPDHCRRHSKADDGHTRREGCGTRTCDWAKEIQVAERELAAGPPVITITKTEPDTWSIRGPGFGSGCNDLEVEDYEAMAKSLGATVVLEDLSEPGPCAHCGKPASCVGSYESNDAPVQRACDECCGHGNEDGWCHSYGGDDE